MPETIEIQLKKGVLGLCVLALLARADIYAYEIASRLSDAIDMGAGIWCSPGIVTLTSAHT